MHLLVLLLIVFGVSQSKTTGLPPPSLWPKPTSASLGHGVLLINPDSFRVDSASKHPFLKQAIERLRGYIKKAGPQVEVIYPAAPIVPYSTGTIDSLQITIQNEQAPLELGVDESYSLVVNKASVLQAKTLWGALHGLTTFAQFAQWNGTRSIFQGMPAQIHDSPKFPWRGMLIDTSRHYLPLSTIKETIDLLAMSKMNVLHWHLVDAESFPLELKTRPEMSRLGSWIPSAVYSERDVKEVMEYARSQGVRVVPEIDTPGHTYSWGKAYPEIVLDCKNLITRKAYPGINNVPLDMTNDKTYQVVADVVKDVAALFDDSYLHLGGDEISSRCVDEFPRVKEWMKKRGMNTADYSDLIKYYEKALIDIVHKNGKKMIFWQELFQMFVNSTENPLPHDVIIHIWINDGSVDLARQIVQAGYHTLISSGWYLDQQLPARDGESTHYLWLDTWQDFYTNDLLQGLRDLSPAEQSRVLGGEVAQWGEQIDEATIITRAWPRAAAAAEQLWSSNMDDVDVAYHRYASHRCRLWQRGHAVSPVRPDFCQRRA